MAYTNPYTNPYKNPYRNPYKNPYKNPYAKETNTSKDTSVSPFSNYNDSTEINSFADVIWNSLHQNDNLKTRDYGILSIIGDADIPIVSNSARMFTGYMDLVRNVAIEPIKQNNFSALGLNALVNLGESLDILASPIKGLVMDGPEGLIKGSVGRVNYDMDTGNFLLDMAGEILLDPFNWVSLGGKAALSGGAKVMLASFVDDVAQAAGGKFIKEGVTETADSIKKKLIANARRELFDVKTGNFIAQSGDDIFDALYRAANRVGEDYFDDAFLTAMRNKQVATLVPQYITDLSILKGINGIVTNFDTVEKILFRGATYGNFVPISMFKDIKTIKQWGMFKSYTNKIVSEVGAITNGFINPKEFTKLANYETVTKPQKIDYVTKTVNEILNRADIESLDYLEIDEAFSEKALESIRVIKQNIDEYSKTEDFDTLLKHIANEIVPEDVLANSTDLYTAIKNTLDDNVHLIRTKLNAKGQKVFNNIAKAYKELTNTIENIKEYEDAVQELKKFTSEKHLKKELILTKEQQEFVSKYRQNVTKYTGAYTHTNNIVAELRNTYSKRLTQKLTKEELQELVKQDISRLTNIKATKAVKKDLQQFLGEYLYLLTHAETVDEVLNIYTKLDDALRHHNELLTEVTSIRAIFKATKEMPYEAVKAKNIQYQNKVIAIKALRNSIHELNLNTKDADELIKHFNNVVNAAAISFPEEIFDSIQDVIHTVNAAQTAIKQSMADVENIAAVKAVSNKIKNLYRVLKDLELQTEDQNRILAIQAIRNSIKELNLYTLDAEGLVKHFNSIINDTTINLPEEVFDSIQDVLDTIGTTQTALKRIIPDAKAEAAVKTVSKQIRDLYKTLEDMEVQAQGVVNYSKHVLSNEAAAARYKDLRKNVLKHKDVLSTEAYNKKLKHLRKACAGGMEALNKAIELANTKQLKSLNKVKDFRIYDVGFEEKKTVFNTKNIPTITLSNPEDARTIFKELFVQTSTDADGNEINSIRSNIIELFERAYNGGELALSQDMAEKIEELNSELKELFDTLITNNAKVDYSTFKQTQDFINDVNLLTYNLNELIIKEQEKFGESLLRHTEIVYDENGNPILKDAIKTITFEDAKLAEDRSGNIIPGAYKGTYSKSTEVIDDADIEARFNNTGDTDDLIPVEEIENISKSNTILRDNLNEYPETEHVKVYTREKTDTYFTELKKLIQDVQDNVRRVSQFNTDNKLFEVEGITVLYAAKDENLIQMYNAFSEDVGIATEMHNFIDPMSTASIELRRLIDSSELDPAFKITVERFYNDVQQFRALESLVKRMSTDPEISEGAFRSVMTSLEKFKNMRLGDLELENFEKELFESIDNYIYGVDAPKSLSVENLLAEASIRVQSDAKLHKRYMEEFTEAERSRFQHFLDYGETHIAEDDAFVQEMLIRLFIPEEYISDTVTDSSGIKTFLNKSKQKLSIADCETSGETGPINEIAHKIMGSKDCVVFKVKYHDDFVIPQNDVLQKMFPNSTYEEAVEKYKALYNPDNAKANELFFDSEKEMLQAYKKYLDENLTLADEVIMHNGSKFDYPTIMARAREHGIYLNQTKVKLSDSLVSMKENLPLIKIDAGARIKIANYIQQYLGELPEDSTIHFLAAANYDSLDNLRAMVKFMEDNTSTFKYNEDLKAALDELKAKYYNLMDANEKLSNSANHILISKEFFETEEGRNILINSVKQAKAELELRMSIASYASLNAAQKAEYALYLKQLNDTLELAELGYISNNISKYMYINRFEGDPALGFWRIVDLDAARNYMDFPTGLKLPLSELKAITNFVRPLKNSYNAIKNVDILIKNKTQIAEQLKNIIDNYSKLVPTAPTWLKYIRINPEDYKTNYILLQKLYNKLKKDLANDYSLTAVQTVTKDLADGEGLAKRLEDDLLRLKTINETFTIKNTSAKQTTGLSSIQDIFKQSYDIPGVQGSIAEKKALEADIAYIKNNENYKLYISNMSESVNTDTSSELNTRYKAINKILNDTISNKDIIELLEESKSLVYTKLSPNLKALDSVTGAEELVSRFKKGTENEILTTYKKYADNFKTVVKRGLSAFGDAIDGTLFTSAFRVKAGEQTKNISVMLDGFNDFLDSLPTAQARAEVIQKIEYATDLYNFNTAKQILELDSKSLLNHLLTNSMVIQLDTKFMYKFDNTLIAKFMNRLDDLNANKINVDFNKEIGVLTIYPMRDAQFKVTLDASGKTICEIQNEIVEMNQLKNIDMSEFLDFLPENLRAQFKQAQDTMNNLSNGIGMGSGYNIVDKKFYTKVYEQLPDTVKNDMLELTHFMQDGLFNKRTRFNTTLFGSQQFCSMYYDYVPGNFIKGYIDSSVTLASRASDKANYIEMILNSDFSINNGAINELSFDEMRKMLEDAPEFNLACLVYNKSNQLELIDLKLNTEADFLLAKQNNAVILPYHVFANAYDVINSPIFEEMNPTVQFMSKLMHSYKRGYLAAGGSIMRNTIDTFAKNIAIADGNVLKALVETMRSMKLYISYNATMNDIFTYSKCQRINKEAINGFFNSGLKTKMTYEEFSNVHEVLNSGALIGEVQALENYRLFTKAKKEGADVSSITDLNDPAIRASLENYDSVKGSLDKIMRVNNDIENIQRLSAYMLLQEKGLNFTQAVYRVSKDHFNYSMKSPREKLIELIIPFYTFKLNNLQYWAESLTNNPWLANLYTDIMTPVWDFDDVDENELKYNKSLQHRILSGNLQLADNGLTLKLNPSASDAFKLMTNPFGEIYNSIFSVYTFMTDAAMTQIAESTGSAVMQNINQTLNIYRPANPSALDNLKSAINLIPYAAAMTQLRNYPLILGLGNSTLLDRLESIMNLGTYSPMLQRLITGVQYAQELGSPLPALAPSIFGRTKQYDQKKYNYNRSYSKTSYGKSNYSRKIYSPRTWTDTLYPVKFKNIYIDGMYSVPNISTYTAQANRYYHFSRLPKLPRSNIYNKLYTSKGKPRWDAMLQPVNSQNLKYVIKNTIHYR